MTARVLVAPQEFKGSLTAREAAEAIVAGLRAAMPDADVVALPLADGGPGTVEALVSATGGELRRAEARDPLGRVVEARWGVLGTRPTAAIEMAAASGLTLLDEAERDPTRTSTAGTGDLLLTALSAGFDRILIGMGGSATNDGSAGLAQALDARLLDADGNELPPGGSALIRLASIDLAARDSRLARADIVAMTDVTNPLCGPDGASLVYGPQKGASPEVARQLDEALAHYAEIIERDLGVDVRSIPGAGAAGGLGAGLVAFCGAKIESGFDVVAETVGLHSKIAAADVVVTGEGRLDRQSAFGKTTAGVARMAGAANKPVLAIVGSVEEGAYDSFDAILAISPELAPPEVAIAKARELLTYLARGEVAAWISARLA